MTSLAEEFPDEILQEDLPEMPDEAWPQPWHGLIWDAWDVLRYDRPYAMGGEMPISFSAIDRYAKRHFIEGQDFEFFRDMLAVIDFEWLAYQEEKRKEKERMSR